jgi:hypothetical protein
MTTINFHEDLHHNRVFISDAIRNVHFVLNNPSTAIYIISSVRGSEVASADVTPEVLTALHKHFGVEGYAPKPSAVEVAYDKAYNETMDNLGFVHSLICVFNSDFETHGKKPNWCHVGSMEHVKTMLQEIVDFLEG